jgi:four helix bundle protein
MRNFRDLDIWKEARKQTKDIYLLMKLMPEDEKFGLTSQIKRCSVSIPSNIAEGSSRKSNKDFSRFLEISLGSCYEVETQLVLCSDLEYLCEKKVEVHIEQIQILERRISAFMNYLSKNL